MDAWTFLNHKAYVAFTIHLEHKGKLMAMLLDINKVAKLHMGVNLAIMFTKMLKDFRISNKVSYSLSQ